MRNVSIDLKCLNNNLSPEPLETETWPGDLMWKTPQHMEACVNVVEGVSIEFGKATPLKYQPHTFWTKYNTINDNCPLHTSATAVWRSEVVWVATTAMLYLEPERSLQALICCWWFSGTGEAIPVILVCIYNYSLLPPNSLEIVVTMSLIVFELIN